jgi:hypothetical protein
MKTADGTKDGKEILLATKMPIIETKMDEF